MNKTINRKYCLITLSAFLLAVICYCVYLQWQNYHSLSVDNLPATTVERGSRGEVVEVSSSSIKFDDVALGRLRNAEDIRILVLFDTSITDVGMKYLSGKGQMEHLALDGSDITDSSMKVVSKLSNLNWLTLSNTKISDDAIIYIAKLKKLMFLDVTNTDVSEAGVRRLRNELPNCDVSH